MVSIIPLGGNNGLKDFFAVMLVEGRIQVHVSLGLTAVTLSMTKGAKLNDGEWHIIQVFRELKVCSSFCPVLVFVEQWKQS